MGFFYSFLPLLGLAACIWWLSGALRRRLKGIRKAAPLSSAGGSGVTPELAGPDTFTKRLYGLAEQFDAFANASAHPRELADHAAFKQAADLLAGPEVSLQTVLQYAQGTNWAIACAALAALSLRADGGGAVDRVVAQCDKLTAWPMYFALDFFCKTSPRPPAGAPVVGAKEWWCDLQIMLAIFRDYFDARAKLGDGAEFGPALERTPSPSPAIIRQFLLATGSPLARQLAEKLEGFESKTVDHPFLTSFGRFWADRGRGAFLGQPESWEHGLASARATLKQTPVRSLLVSGEPLVGKTTLLRLVARSLAPEGWRVFEASAADLMAGQQWFGQLEGRIQQVVGQLSVSKKLIWYIPDLMQLAQSGTHRGQSASILDQILPAMQAGQLVVWSEATPAGVARLLQFRPGMRNLLEVVRLEPQSEESTLALADGLVKQLSSGKALKIDAGCAATAVNAARQYLGAASLPGSALQLLNLAAGRAKTAEAAIAPLDILKTLSQLTGLPVSILDSNETIDVATIGNFFRQRVIGHDEAVNAVIDRIIMLKAGLNDPDRPIGVLLFAGPTGTGKTELAKAASSYLFGSVDRLIRLDMSELQTPEAVRAIVGDGGPGETSTLISQVRKRPFSVVLLDEFEKVHPRIWDLFLQVFDDARLSDANGEVADFRHCLIIMTTNLGATEHQSAGMGFAPAGADFAADQVTAAIRRTYRPEFQNRIDKIIVFRPLTRELMRVILDKELGDVLERRGLKNRTWAVEWEASALEFLLERGFSPEMGARPLKRAIEQYVIAPLAATIVEKRFPEGDQFVFFRSDGRSVLAEFVDPDSDGGSSDRQPVPDGDGDGDGALPTLATMILSPHGTAAEFAALTERWAGIEDALGSTQWETIKSDLANEMRHGDFWKRPDRHLILGRLALMDRVAAAARTAGSLYGRLQRGSHRAGHYSRELVARLALQLHLVADGIKDVHEDAAIEVALIVEPVFAKKTRSDENTDAWRRQLHDMYRGWSGKRHMQVSELEPGSPGGLPMLLVTGFGAYRLLSGECGLHVLELAGPDGGASRATARVRVAVASLGDIPAARLAGAVADALARAPASSKVIRRYRRDPAPLVRSGDGSRRSGKVDAILSGDFDLLAAG